MKDLIHVYTGRIGFRMPLHTIMSVSDNGFDDAVGCLSYDVESFSDLVYRLMVARRDDVLAFHAQKFAFNRDFVVGDVMTDVLWPLYGNILQ